MATKKKAVDPLKKLIVTAIKKTVKTNSVLPILADAYLNGEELEVTDLETSVVIPFRTPGFNGCIPANKLIDVLEMMDEPEFKPVFHTPLVPEHFVIAGKQYKGSLDVFMSHFEDRILKEQNEQEYVATRPTFFPELTQDELHPETTTVGATISEGKRVVKISGEDPMNFPIHHLRSCDIEEWNHIGTLDESDLEFIEEAIQFASKDDLRPAMTGIFFSDNIVATDTHRLIWKKINPMLEDFILPKKSANILIALGGKKWEIFYGAKKKSDNEFESARYVLFMNEDGVTVTTHAIDARFPDYKCVIPVDKEHTVRMYVDKNSILKELKRAGKFANQSTHQVNLTMNGSLILSSQEVDYGEEFQYEFPKKEADIVFRGYNPKAGNVKPEPLAIGFNEKFLSDIISQHKTDDMIIMKFWGPEKAAVINDKYLLMPLMIYNSDN